MIKNGYRYGSNCYSAFFYKFPIHSLIASFFFYTPFLLHLHPPRTDQMVGVNTCPISTLLKSSCSSCKAENHCSGITSTLMRWERVSYRAFNIVVAAFSPDILRLLSVLCFFNAYLCQQNFLKHPPRWQITSMDLGFGEPRRYSSWAQTPGPLWSKLTSFSTNMDYPNHIYSFSNNVTS